MDENLLLIALVLFFVTAALYASAGFGGGSTYLALLVLFGVSYQDVPSMALICNIIVVSGGLWFHHRAGTLSLKLVIPFLLSSVPMAFLGGQIPVGKTLFLILLGITLLVASLQLLITEKKFEACGPKTWREALKVGMPVGAVLGFVSGITGIGGGIFLAPGLYFLRWGNARQVAAAASLFIFVNSFAGLSGQLIKNSFRVSWTLILPLALAVFFGGQIGSRLCTRQLNKIVLQRLTGALVFLVSLRIFWQLGFS